ncbi:MAG: alpha-amylase [Spirochaetes bacterium]|nr:MAG: alpha-amylase [Spirochaetota bacterium]
MVRPFSSFQWYKGVDLADFDARMEANYRDIRFLFSLLYGNRRDSHLSFKKLMEALRENYHSRPDELRQIDIQRELDPGWFLSNRLVSTMLYVDQYAGNLKEFLKKIPYLRELGINVVHLMPLLKCPAGNNDGGYAVSDYHRIDERYGSMEDLRRIAWELRKEKMYLILDLVVNHTSDEHEWAKRARSGDPYYQNYYYMFDDRSIPDQFEETFPEIFPEAAPGNFTWIPEIKKWVMTVFHNFQWDLNYTNPTVFIEMVKILFFLANQGVDIVRLDAVPYLWKKIGTTGQNLEEAHIILRLMRLCAEIVCPGVLFIAEAIVQPEEIVKYFGTDEFAGRESHLAYHASLMVFFWDAIATTNSRMLRKGLENTPPNPQGTGWLVYIRCHDDIGLGFSDRDAREVGYDPFLHRKFLQEYYTGKFPGSSARGSLFMFNPKNQDARISGTTASLVGLEKALEEGNRLEIDICIRKIILLYSLVMSIDGLPILYYGDEVGYTNDYFYRNHPVHRYDNRWMHRPKIDWDKVERRKIEGSVENRIFTQIKRLISIRKSSPEFSGDSSFRLIDPENEHVFSCLREKEKRRTLVLANVSGERQFINSSILHGSGLLEHVFDKFSGNAPAKKSGKIILEPYSFYWLSEAE